MRTLKRLIRRCVFYVLRTLMALQFKIKVSGLENIPDVPNALIVANHSSYLDAFVLGFAFYSYLPKIRWVISKENYKLWFLKWLYWCFRVIVVNGTVEKVKESLNEGTWVVIFPEGAKNWCLKTDQSQKKMFKGTSVIALSTGVPIIPVGIKGADKVLPPTSFKLQPQYLIEIKIGESFGVGVCQQEKIEDALLIEKLEEIMQHIKELI